MFIITNKENNAILMHGERLDYLSNGYPRLINENVSFFPDMIHIHEAENVPSEVEAEKWCYTEADGFYLNPNWHEPSPFDNPAYAEGYEQAILDMLEMEGEE